MADTQVKAAVQPISVELDELIAGMLDKVVRYKYKDRIALHGVVSVEKEIRFLREEVLKDLIRARHEALANQMKERVLKEASAYFRLLVSKGTPVDQAYKMAYDQ